MSDEKNIGPVYAFVPDINCKVIILVGAGQAVVENGDSVLLCGQTFKVVKMYDPFLSPVTYELEKINDVSERDK